mmetsp:Transcript_77848/g.241269  ORF Transcript_77848/g.241269 Transcript_77848/m.241269 type:complete len:252 (+) Transcript_77848:469-1224(+)
MRFITMLGGTPTWTCSACCSSVSCARKPRISVRSSRWPASRTSRRVRTGALSGKVPGTGTLVHPDDRDGVPGSGVAHRASAHASSLLSVAWRPPERVRWASARAKWVWSLANCSRRRLRSSTMSCTLALFPPRSRMTDSRNSEKLRLGTRLPSHCSTSIFTRTYPPKSPLGPASANSLFRPPGRKSEGVSVTLPRKSSCFPQSSSSTVNLRGSVGVSGPNFPSWFHAGSREFITVCVRSCSPALPGTSHRQ